jgi:hypothetical protein
MTKDSSFEAQKNQPKDFRNKSLSSQKPFDQPIISDDSLLDYLDRSSLAIAGSANSGASQLAVDLSSEFLCHENSAVIQITLNESPEIALQHLRKAHFFKILTGNVRLEEIDSILNLRTCCIQSSFTAITNSVTKFSKLQELLLIELKRLQETFPSLREVLFIFPASQSVSNDPKFLCDLQYRLSDAARVLNLELKFVSLIQLSRASSGAFTGTNGSLLQHFSLVDTAIHVWKQAFSSSSVEISVHKSRFGKFKLNTPTTYQLSSQRILPELLCKVRDGELPTGISLEDLKIFETTLALKSSISRKI